MTRTADTTGALAAAPARRRTGRAGGRGNAAAPGVTAAARTAGTPE